jgi:hypothetical protein
MLSRKQFELWEFTSTGQGLISGDAIEQRKYAVSPIQQYHKEEIYKQKG